MKIKVGSIVLLLIFTLTTVSTVGSAQAGNGGIPPLCPPDIPLSAGTINGVPICAVDASCPPGDTSIDNLGNCQPISDEPPECPPGTTLDFDICYVLSTCPSGTALNPTSLLCELTDQLAVGGTIIPIESAALLLAGIQTSIVWIIPIVIAGVGLTAFKIRRS